MNEYPGGVWPVMLTPFKTDGSIDEKGLRALVDWYIEKGCKGLFASCQSSEIFHMTREERIRIARITVDQTAGRVPVVASGCVEYPMDEQVKDIEGMAAANVDAVILLTNRLAREGEPDAVLLDSVHTILSRIDGGIRLGLYECPNPYKRVLSLPVIDACAKTGRFYFLKDTCCDAAFIKRKIEATRGTNLKLYNANATTALQAMRDGAAGYSGIMANFHPELYVWLTENYAKPEADRVQDALTMASLIERQLYPVNAKFHLKMIEKLPVETTCRVQDDRLLTDTFQTEIYMMNRVCDDLYARYCK